MAKNIVGQAVIIQHCVFVFFVASGCVFLLFCTLFHKELWANRFDHDPGWLSSTWVHGRLSALICIILLLLNTWTHCFLIILYPSRCARVTFLHLRSRVLMFCYVYYTSRHIRLCFSRGEMLLSLLSYRAVVAWIIIGYFMTALT